MESGSKTGDASRLSELVRRHRTAATLSQEALAERAGLSVRAISDLERGVRQVPRLETVRVLAAALERPESDRAELLAAARPQVMVPVHMAPEQTLLPPLPLSPTR